MPLIKILIKKPSTLQISYPRHFIKIFDSYPSNRTARERIGPNQGSTLSFLLFLFDTSTIPFPPPANEIQSYADDVEFWSFDILQSYNKMCGNDEDRIILTLTRKKQLKFFSGISWMNRSVYLSKVNPSSG